MVDRRFELARSGQDDFGWWLLHPNTRTDLVGSIDAYREAMSSVDWSAFSYEVVASRLHDGEYGVDIHVAGGMAGVPEPVRAWGLIQFSLTDGEGSEVGVMKLEIPPFAEGGIVGIGGRKTGL